jgi:hypothetical protein
MVPLASVICAAPRRVATALGAVVIAVYQFAADADPDTIVIFIVKVGHRSVLNSHFSEYLAEVLIHGAPDQIGQIFREADAGAGGHEASPAGEGILHHDGTVRKREYVVVARGGRLVGEGTLVIGPEGVFELADNAGIVIGGGDLGEAALDVGDGHQGDSFCFIVLHLACPSSMS